jgi:hypothetical protein
MFTIKWLEQGWSDYDNLKTAAKVSLLNRQRKKTKKSTKHEGIFKQVSKTLYYLETNPKHPGLQTHEYDGIENPIDKKQKVFEAYAQNNTPGAYRVFWCYGPGKKEITIIAITPHP